MKLSQLSDQALLEQTQLLVRKEKEILSEILTHLEEVRKRRLFCELGCGSLFQYCVKHLGYSEDQAYRRVNALKLMKEIPDVQSQIAQGELTLSTLTVAQSLFKTDQSVDKKEVLLALKNKTKREAEKVVREFSSKMPVESKKVLLSLSKAQEEKWNAVKAKLSHCNLKEEEVLERLCDFFLDPKPTPKSSPKVVVENAAPRPAPSRNSALVQKSPAGSRPTKSIQREVFCKANHKCENCGSLYALEIDHKKPRSLGGTHDPKNLRILCRACNQRAAIQMLGKEKMLKYLE